MVTRLVAAAVVVIATVGGSASVAGAHSEHGEDKNCWGVVSSQLAGFGSMGEHASEQTEPRAGLGNLARDLGFDHISEMGTFLAEIDGIDATECGSSGA